MALNSVTCGTALKNAIEGMTVADKQDTEKIWQILMEVIFDHIKDNAEVNTVVTGSADLMSGDVDGSGEGGIT